MSGERNCDGDRSHCCLRERRCRLRGLGGLSGLGCWRKLRR